MKLYFGDTGDDDPKRMEIFLKELAKLHLPMINFQEIDEIYKKSAIEPKKQELSKTEDMMVMEGI